MIIISLDQALVNTGYAIFKNNKLQSYGSFNIKKSLPIEERLYQLHKELCNVSNIADDEKIDLLVMEDIQLQMGDVTTYKKLAYVQASIMLWCLFQGVKFEIYAPTHWRSVLGGGFGKKREEQKQNAIFYVKNNFGIDVDSDVADAICIGAAAIKERKNAF